MGQVYTDGTERQCPFFKFRNAWMACGLGTEICLIGH